MLRTPSPDLTGHRLALGKQDPWPVRHRPLMSQAEFVALAPPPQPFCFDFRALFCGSALGNRSHLGSGPRLGFSRRDALWPMALGRVAAFTKPSCGATLPFTSTFLWQRLSSLCAGVSAVCLGGHRPHPCPAQWCWGHLPSPCPTGLDTRPPESGHMPRMSRGRWEAGSPSVERGRELSVHDPSPMRPPGPPLRGSPSHDPKSYCHGRPSSVPIGPSLPSPLWPCPVCLVRTRAS